MPSSSLWRQRKRLWWLPKSSLSRKNPVPASEELYFDRIASQILFADDVILLALLVYNLQHVMKQSTVASPWNYLFYNVVLLTGTFHFSIPLICFHRFVWNFEIFILDSRGSRSDKNIEMGEAMLLCPWVGVVWLKLNVLEFHRKVCARNIYTIYKKRKTSGSTLLAVDSLPLSQLQLHFFYRCMAHRHIEDSLLLGSINCLCVSLVVVIIMVNII